METLQTIKSRIKSIDSIIKATNAMKMVSTVKLAKLNSLPKDYAKMVDMSYEMLCTAAFEAVFAQSFDNDFWLLRKTGETLILVLSTDQGFCGAFNQNILSATRELMEKHNGAFVEVLGKKASGIASDMVNFAEKCNIQDRYDVLEISAVLSDLIMKYILEKNVCNVFLISGAFKNVLTQSAKVTKLFPIEIQGASKEYVLIEGRKQEVVSDICKVYMQSILCSFVNEHLVSELSARTMSMDNSVRNARDMFANLNVLYNRIRQFRITQELTEIISSIECMR